MVTASSYARKLVKKRSEEQMLATVTILRGEFGALDLDTGKVGGLQNTQVIYSGKARIWTVDGSGVLSIGEANIDTRRTYISYPIDAPVAKRDDLVVIGQADLSDPDLDNRVFRVLEVDGGGFISETRRMSCQSFYPNRYWGEQ